MAILETHPVYLEKTLNIDIKMTFLSQIMQNKPSKSTIFSSGLGPFQFHTRP